MVESETEPEARPETSYLGVMYWEQAKIINYTEEQYDLIVDTNLKSVFFCNQPVARHMIAREGGGSIVNISSQAASMIAGHTLAVDGGWTIV